MRRTAMMMVIGQFAPEIVILTIALFQASVTCHVTIIARDFECWRLRKIM